MDSSMCLLVDSRIGSEDLATPLEKRGLPVYRNPDGTLPMLDSADIAFEGARSGKTFNVGIELKKLGDLVSSLRTGRLGEQLARMVGPDGAYDYGFLLIEGRWGIGPTGQLTVPRRWGWVPAPGKMMASEMVKQVLTFDLCGGFHVCYCDSRAITLHFIETLYRWFHDKDMTKHKSHLATHTPVSFLPVSEFRAAVMKWPGIGLQTSLAVESHFKGSIIRAATGTVAEWANIKVINQGKSRKIGTAVAARIVDFCRGDR